MATKKGDVKNVVVEYVAKHGTVSTVWDAEGVENPWELISNLFKQTVEGTIKGKKKNLKRISGAIKTWEVKEKVKSNKRQIED